MKLLAWIILCFFLVGVQSQVTPSISISNTNSNSNSNSNSYSTSYSNSYISVSNTNSNSNSNSISNSISTSISTSNSYSNSYSTSNSNSISNSYSTSISSSYSYSTSYSTSQNLYSPPFNFKSSERSHKRPQNIQCKYSNPNLYCRWQPGKIGYKRIRLQVDCNSTNTFFVQGVNEKEFLAVYNTSTPEYPRGTPAANQQTTLVSLDLPPSMPCQGILTVHMHSNIIGTTFDNTTGVTYTTSRFWFTGKTEKGVFQTARSLLMF
jgi:hypothetical protein